MYYLISDLHLSKEKSKSFNLLNKFLNQYLDNPKALFILGDLFDAWLGIDLMHDYASHLFQTIQSKCSNIYFIKGNREAFLEKNILENFNITELADLSTYQFYDTPITLSHGDTLCTKDTEYINFKNNLTSEFKSEILQLDQKIRLEYSAYLKEKQKMYEYSEKFDAVQSDIEKHLIKNKTRIIIHGHTHQPAHHLWTQHNQTHHRFVLGDWDNDHGWFIKITPSDIDLFRFS